MQVWIEGDGSSGSSFFQIYDETDNLSHEVSSDEGKIDNNERRQTSKE